MRSTVLFAFAFAASVACKNTSAPEPNAAAPQPESTSPSTVGHGASHGELPPGHPPMGAGHGAPGMGAGMGNGAAPQGADVNLQWTDPPAWHRTPPSSAMRRAQFSIPGPGGDAELAVFYFGAGQGGDVEANLQRWYGQFTQPDGRPTSAVATRSNVTVGALRVTVTTATGTFAGGGMPGGPAAAPRENQALLGAIVESSGGPWFFKITGPAATVTAARPAFDAMIQSMHQ